VTDRQQLGVELSTHNVLGRHLSIHTHDERRTIGDGKSAAGSTRVVGDQGITVMYGNR
jgi:hypothetical protein